MIKLSNDNIFFWSRFFGGSLVIIHLFFISVLLSWGFWPAFIPYLLIALLQFLVGRVWRYLFLRDVYIEKDSKKIMFKKINGETSEFDCKDIKSFKTSFGITDITIYNSEKKQRLYFMPNSKENLEFLNDY